MNTENEKSQLQKDVEAIVAKEKESAAQLQAFKIRCGLIPDPKGKQAEKR